MDQRRKVERTEEVEEIGIDVRYNNVLSQEGEGERKGPLRCCLLSNDGVGTPQTSTGATPLLIHRSYLYPDVRDFRTMT